VSGMSDFRIDELDDVIHGRIRLGVMAYLVGADRAAFKDLAERSEASDGNLSVHLRKLEEAGYIGIEKRFSGRKPLAEASITEAGRAAFTGYLDSIAKLLEG